MIESLMSVLRCPVTRSPLTLQKIKISNRKFENNDIEIIEEGILFGVEGWFYPLLKGIPRMNIEAIYEYKDFLEKYLPDYSERIDSLHERFNPFIEMVKKRTRRTRESFSKEWSFYNYESDKTWGSGAEEMLKIFLDETDESIASLKDKIIFDNETSQTDQIVVLLTPDKRTVTKENKFSVDFFDEFSGGSFITAGDIIPNVFEVFGG